LTDHNCFLEGEARSGYNLLGHSGEMNSMKRAIRYLLLVGIAAVWFVTPSLFAREYCPLTVQVVTPNGKRPEAQVEVREKNGRRIEKEQAPGRDLTFCDLGILPVTVIVGLKDCEVVVSDVYLRWGEPYTLRVTYDQENCMDDRPKPTKPLCQTLLRVNSPDKKWVNGATVKFDDPSREPLQTDEAGRALFSLVKGDTAQGFLSAPGFETLKFSVTCSEPQVQEKTLTLLKK
jgi:hypothetical protein